MSLPLHSHEPQAWEQCLELLNQRDGVVEMTGLSLSLEQGLPPTFRVRLLANRPGGLVVDRPDNPLEAKYFQPGAVVSLLVADGASRWQLMTSVSGRIRYKLNEHAEVLAMVLSRPHEVTSVQRRSFYRASTAGCQMEPVELTPLSDPTPVGLAHGHAGPSHAGANLVLPLFTAPSFRGHLLNVGGGGMGIEAPQSVAMTLAQYRRYRCAVRLPSMDHPDHSLVADCRLVHLEPQQGGSHYMGLAFDMTDPATLRQCVDHICHFTSWLQRQQLQRRKQKH